MDSPQIAHIRGYLKAIEAGHTAREMTSWLHPEMVQQEFPNRFSPNGATRDLNAMHEASLRGQKVISRQSYTVLMTVEQGDQVGMEVQWTGTLKVAVGSIPVGGEMRARFGVFFTSREGRIISQRNYDCFDPF